jgi:excisionase family DNA binding protein
MSTTRYPHESDCLALSAAQVAKLLGISQRHLWALNAAARVPRSIRFGRSVRWSLDELRAWLAAGARERAEWEATRQ